MFKKELLPGVEMCLKAPRKIQCISRGRSLNVGEENVGRKKKKAGDQTLDGGPNGKKTVKEDGLDDRGRIPTGILVGRGAPRATGDSGHLQAVNENNFAWKKR